VFVSEYAVTGNDAGRGSFLAGLAEAGFLIGIELNRFANCTVRLHYSHTTKTPNLKP
jgi:hypothetical protein